MHLYSKLTCILFCFWRTNVYSNETESITNVYSKETESILDVLGSS